MRIGIIGGNGWIGGAIARAAVGAKLLPPGDLTLSCRSQPPGWLPDAYWTHDNQARRPVGRRDPLGPPAGLGGNRGLAAGQARHLGHGRGDARRDRSAPRDGAGRPRLPNAAAEVGKSYTPWTVTGQVTDADRATVRRLLESFGTEDEVATEAEIDYMTGLSGTGPAYPALLAVAMMRDAVAHGVPPDVAGRAVVAMLVGTGRLLEKNGEDPEDTVAAFVEYREVTAAGIEAMRAAGFEAATAAGLAAALQKSRSLGA